MVSGPLQCTALHSGLVWCRLNKTASLCTALQTMGEGGGEVVPRASIRRETIISPGTLFHLRSHNTLHSLGIYFTSSSTCATQYIFFLNILPRQSGTLHFSSHFTCFPTQLYISQAHITTLSLRSTLSTIIFSFPALH